MKATLFQVLGAVKKTNNFYPNRVHKYLSLLIIKTRPFLELFLVNLPRQLTAPYKFFTIRPCEPESRYNWAA